MIDCWCLCIENLIPEVIVLGGGSLWEVTKRSSWVEWLTAKVSFLLTTSRNPEWPEKILGWGTAWIGLISGQVFVGLSWLLSETGKPTRMPAASFHQALDPELCSSKESWLSRNRWKQAYVHFIHSSLDCGCDVISWFQFTLWSLLCDGLWPGIISQINLVLP